MDSSKGTSCIIRNTTQWDIPSSAGVQYEIRVSWPLSWKYEEPGNFEGKKANVIYVPDGNAFFYSTMEAVRRRACIAQAAPDVVVVGIGYPMHDTVWLWHEQRRVDLTPPCEMIEWPPGFDGKPHQTPYGGADKFLDFIQDELKPFIKTKAFPGINILEETLWGHSYGGLFALHALFTRSTIFDIYVAASASVEWNATYILKEEEKFLAEKSKGERKEKLALYWGSYEQPAVRGILQTDEDWEVRRQIAVIARQRDHAVEMYDRLLKSGRFSKLEKKEYPEEDHISVTGCAIEGGITFSQGQF